MDHIERSRLTQLLDRGLTRRLTLVSAPAGCGKTTLLSAWQPPGYLVAWIPLNAGNEHLRDFVRRIIGAVEGVSRSTLSATRSLLLLADRPAPAALAARLADELAEVPAPLVIVLDDFHVIRDHDVLTLVGRFLALTAEQTHLVIATREDPHLPTATLRARAELAEIDLHQLLFTADETQAFLAASLPYALDAAYAEQLALQTDGWPAGLRLASLELASAPMTHDP